eukprot:TRINITY_DN93873_c0_g1_i1.p1 TRINITY_DN93873_c0_g1~~TRINITY_DN93873_c0_g1_i1.p1  ORF type:complete len:385 (-),score=56.36 TRINITY_DN93873_c0_g1_i1:52-1206(-)
MAAASKTGVTDDFSDSPWWLPLVTFLVILEVLLLLLWYVASSLLRRSKASDASEDSAAKQTAQPELGNGNHLVLVNAAPCGPKGQDSRSDALQATEFDSGICHGSWLCMHKPTDDPETMERADYPHAEHLHGRKRLWEFRLQLKFREEVPGDMFFGCEQDRYYHVPTVEKYISSSVISLLRHASGDGMYQTHGDDPRYVRGENERPAIVFPLWVMDQLIISNEGEEPPSLVDPQFCSYGIIRAQDRKGMQEAIKDLKFRPGPTFTFGFWCIAQFVDAVGWKVPARGVIPEVKLNEIGTHPPAYITMYSLKPECEWEVQEARDTRHLDSRKIYIWRVAIWSSLMPPEPERKQELLAKASTTMKRRSSEGSLRNRQKGFCWCSPWG